MYGLLTMLGMAVWFLTGGIAVLASGAKRCCKLAGKLICVRILQIIVELGYKTLKDSFFQTSSLFTKVRQGQSVCPYQ
jgi:hypothetical protein